MCADNDILPAVPVNEERVRRLFTGERRVLPCRRGMLSSGILPREQRVCSFVLFLLFFASCWVMLDTRFCVLIIDSFVRVYDAKRAHTNLQQFSSCVVLTLRVDLSPMSLGGDVAVNQGLCERVHVKKIRLQQFILVDFFFPWH